MLFTAIKPMIVKSGEEAFDHDDYIFEPKWDGWRLLLHKQGERIEAYTRSGQIVTSKFPELEAAAAAIKAHTAIVDCEGIVLRGGKPVFDDFVYRGRISRTVKIRDAVRTHPVTFIVFDLLWRDSSLMNEPLMERKRQISEIVPAAQVIMPTLYVEKQGKSLFDSTREWKLEGIVAKNKNSTYTPDAISEEWLKIKHAMTIDVIILGYRTAPFSIAIGLNFRTIRNKPVGIVDQGFTVEDQQLFLKAAQPLHTTMDKKTQWIKPQICCRIEYLERTDAHQLLRTLFKGFLWDKQPEACVWSYS
jgi:bifunctional non-homologous end joining protein LigD